MPARGTGNSLDAQEISDVTEYVLKLSGQPSDAAKAAAGQEVFDGEGGCYDCHTPDGLGDEAIGAANLREPRGWLYGGTRADILATVTLGRESICPAFAGKVDATMARAMAVFVLSKAQTLRAIVPLKPSPGVQERPRS
jgi:cytochrome c oxidase cbb3-type subunit 3